MSEILGARVRIWPDTCTLIISEAGGQGRRFPSPSANTQFPP